LAGKRRSGYDALLIGGGIAGLAAASQAAQYGLSAALLEPSALLGGQVATVTSIEGFPALGAIAGAELAAILLTRARREGVILIEEAAHAVTTVGKQFQVTTASQTLRARAVIVATGGRRRELGVPKEQEFLGKGVSHCASCDGPLFRNEHVVVVGGGDAALQEAALLAPICRSVTLVVRGGLRARRTYIDRAKSFVNLTFMWDSVVEAICGETSVSGVIVRNLETGTRLELPCAGLFPFIGAVPNTSFLGEGFEKDPQGRLRTEEWLVTSRTGIYAIGAVRHGFSGELASATADGTAVMKAIAA
jgi:thioredoxin reductase (NADPH)